MLSSPREDVGDRSRDAMRTKRVVLVDDDLTVLTIVADALVEVGFSVTRCRSGEEALRELWERPVDVIVTDLLLPRMSGLDLLRELRQRHLTRDTPAIAISALEVQDVLLQDCVAHGCFARILHKPFRLPDLVSAIDGAVHQSGARAVAQSPTPPIGIEKARRVESLARSFEHDHAQVIFGDRRSDSRVAVQLDVGIDGARECLAEYTTNLSSGGLFIKTYDPLAVETPVELSLALPFKKERVKLKGRVVRSISVESAEARTSGPGMGICVIDFPKELHESMEAFIAGVRAGQATKFLSEPGIPLVLIGLEDSLPADAPSFLWRAGIRVRRTSAWGEAITILEHDHPQTVATKASALGMTAPEVSEAVAKLTRSGAQAVYVVATAGEAKQISQAGCGAVVLDGSLAPHELLRALADRLSITRRRHPRVKCIATVSGKTLREAIYGVLENVSLGGMLMISPNPCGEGERFDFEFQLPESEHLIRGVAKVARVRAVSGESLDHKVGACFEKLEEGCFDLLRAFINSRVGLEGYLKYLNQEYYRND